MYKRNFQVAETL